MTKSNGRSNGNGSGYNYMPYDPEKDMMILLTEKQVLEKMHFTRSTLVRMQDDEHGFPPPIRISTGKKRGYYRWILAEVNYWMLRRAKRRERTASEKRMCENSKISDKTLAQIDVAVLGAQLGKQPLPLSPEQQRPVVQEVQQVVPQVEPQPAPISPYANSYANPQVVNGLRGALDEIRQRIDQLEMHMGFRSL